MRPSRHLLWAFMSGINGLIWDGPKSTDSVALVTANISPRPTARVELVKRDAWPASYCGFIGGTMSLGVTCSAHSSCAWHTDYYIVGCCATASKACLFFTSCIDLNSPATAADDPLVFTCRGTKTCFQNQYPSNYRQWGCGYNGTSIELTYSNMTNDAATIAQVFVGNKDLLAITTATKTITITVSAQPVGSETSSVQASTYSGPTTATIVGAAVGGSAVLFLAGLILVCLIFYRKRQKVEPPPVISSPIAMSSPAPHLPSSTFGFHPSVGYYNKDQFQLVPTSANSRTHSSFLSDGSPNPFFLPQPQQLRNEDTVYYAYQPALSPPQVPISPTPREMDARSFRSFGISRRPVGGYDEESPHMPSPMR